MWTASEHGRHPTTTASHVVVAYGENPAMKGMKPSGGDSPIDGVAAEPEGEQLAARHHSVLTRGERRDHPVGRLTLADPEPTLSRNWLVFARISAVNASQVSHPADVEARHRTRQRADVTEG